MSVLSGANQPIYASDVGWLYVINLANDMSGTATIIAATVVVDYSATGSNPWIAYSPSLQSAPATFSGQAISAYVGNGTNPVGYLRIRSHVTTSESPAHTFDDVTSPPIQVLSDTPPS